MIDQPLPLSAGWHRVDVGVYTLGSFRMVHERRDGSVGWHFSSPAIEPTYVGDTFREAADGATALLRDAAAENRMKPRYCGEWHNPGPDGKFGPDTDANCVREPGHSRKTPHSGLGGDPLWFDADPTANLNAEVTPWTAPRFERRSWERNGTGLVLTHLPNRRSVALHDGGDVLAWLTDADAHTLAATLDRMLTDPPPTYGGGTFGDDDG